MLAPRATGSAWNCPIGEAAYSRSASKNGAVYRSRIPCSTVLCRSVTSLSR